MCAGNSKGLIVPSFTTDQEMIELRIQLPTSVKLARVDEKLSALGNVIVCNDFVALIHPELDS
jgi:translation initiation factor 6